MPDFVLSKSVFSVQEQNEIRSMLHGLTQIQSAKLEFIGYVSWKQKTNDPLTKDR